jgi:hypothetical protein
MPPDTTARAIRSTLSRMKSTAADGEGWEPGVDSRQATDASVSQVDACRVKLLAW